MNKRKEKDENGQITTYTWNGDNKLTEVVLPSGDVIQYRYDAEGMRVKKIADGNEVKYLLDGLAVLCEYDGSGNIIKEYVPGISMKENGNTYYYIMDRLGNVRYVLNESGAVVQSYLYTPFGQVHSSSGSLSNPYQYVGGEGYYTEQDINLQLLGQRWYDAEVGRFISRDPAMNGRNFYIYAFSNPIEFTDPKGLESEKECLKRVKEKYKNCLKRASQFWDQMVRLCQQATQIFGVRLPDIFGGCMQECLGLIPPFSGYYNYPPGHSPVDTYNAMVKKCTRDYKVNIRLCKNEKCK